MNYPSQYGRNMEESSDMKPNTHCKSTCTPNKSSIPTKFGGDDYFSAESDTDLGKKNVSPRIPSPIILSSQATQVSPLDLAVIEVLERMTQLLDSMAGNGKQ